MMAYSEAKDLWKKRDEGRHAFEASCRRVLNKQDVDDTAYQEQIDQLELELGHAFSKIHKLTTEIAVKELPEDPQAVAQAFPELREAHREMRRIEKKLTEAIAERHRVPMD